MNNPDHISESLKTIFWFKIRKFFDADPGSRMEKIRIRDKHPGAATLYRTLIFKLKCTRPGINSNTADVAHLRNTPGICYYNFMFNSRVVCFRTAVRAAGAPEPPARPPPPPAQADP